MVAEEKRCFILLSSQRARLKSAITVPRLDQQRRWRALRTFVSWRRRTEGRWRRRVEKEEMWPEKENLLIWGGKI